MRKFLLVAILILGFVSRAYQYKERFIYAHDSDLASWIVKDIVVNHHTRLIGQLTSSPGIFIGSLFYYSLIPFYLLTNMDPIGSVAFSWIVGLVGIVSIYYVFRKLHGVGAGLISALIYSVSFTLSDRQVVPTTPVMLWSIWFFYGINLWWAGNKRSLWILAVLFALVWHLNLALGLLAPLVLWGVWINRKSLKIKDFIGPLVIFLLLSSPLLAFEARHNFQQTRSLINIFNPSGTHQKPVGGLVSKTHKTIYYAAKNSNSIFYTYMPAEPLVYVLPLILLGALYVIRTNKEKILGYSLWIILYVVFFSLNPINLSEYYLAGLNILSIAGFVLLAESIWKKGKKAKILISGILVLFFVHNFASTLLYVPLPIGYIEKKAIVEEIKNDAVKHGYPCVSVSYITDIGYDLGYRYFFYLTNLHVNPPSKLSPVYSIVFPQSRVDKLDKSFGAIGLIYPDYGRYNEKDVAASCVGENPNLTSDMFGFTK